MDLTRQSAKGHARNIWLLWATCELSWSMTAPSLSIGQRLDHDRSGRKSAEAVT